MPDWYCDGPLITGGQRDTEAKLTPIQAGRALQLIECLWLTFKQTIAY